MLISCIGPRLRSAGMGSAHRLAMQDVRELLHEALEAVAQPLDEVHLALESRAHRAPCAVHHVARIGAALVAKLGELAVARLEHALERADAVAMVHRALVERVEILSAPELALELERLRDGAAK